MKLVRPVSKVHFLMIGKPVRFPKNNSYLVCKRLQEMLSFYSIARKSTADVIAEWHSRKDPKR